MKGVLLVDDSATMLLSLKCTLEMNGFSVDTTPDGEAALKKLQGGLRRDLIITDINMPKLDGIGLIKEARKLLRFTPILALTTDSRQSKRDEAKKSGATGFRCRLRPSSVAAPTGRARQCTVSDGKK